MLRSIAAKICELVRRSAKACPHYSSLRAFIISTCVSRAHVVSRLLYFSAASKDVEVRTESIKGAVRNLQRNSRNLYFSKYWNQ